MSRNVVLGGESGDDARIAALGAKLEHEGELMVRQVERTLARIDTSMGVVRDITFGRSKLDSRFARIVLATGNEDVIVFVFAHRMECEQSALDGENLDLGGLEVGHLAEIAWSWNAAMKEKHSYRILEAVVHVEPMSLE